MNVNLLMLHSTAYLHKLCFMGWSKQYFSVLNCTQSTSAPRFFILGRWRPLLTLEAVRQTLKSLQSRTAYVMLHTFGVGFSNIGRHADRVQ